MAKPIEEILEEVRQALPDPFLLEARRSDVFGMPVARELIDGGQESADRLLTFLEDQPEPHLAKVAVMLLSALSPEVFYSRLLAVLSRQSPDLVAAYEPGIWWVRLPSDQIARELVSLAVTSRNPSVLLLLQRPEARGIREPLRYLIQEHRDPASRHALYALGYALRPDDVPLLREVSRWSDDPDAAARAGLYLLGLGSIDGVEGVRAGLASADQDLREATYRDLAPFLRPETVQSRRFDPGQPPDSQQQAIAELVYEAARAAGNRSTDHPGPEQ
jgi:hypothetical protein